jgi:tetratricopeptide (TPR) repeat protein
VYYRAAEAQVRTGREVFPRARAVAAAAIEREPANAKAHLWHAVARVYGEWDWSGGGDELRRAAALDPASVQARRALAAYLSATGDDEGALAAIEAARRLDPVCLAVTADRALYLYRARRFDEAAAAWEEILQVRDDAAPHEGLFQLHRIRGRHDRAKAEALRVMTLVGVPAASVDGLSRRPPAQAVRSFLSGALAHLTRPGTGAAPERLAVLRAALGETGPALGLLDQACQDHSPGLPRTLRDPAFDALRPTARFQRVRDCVGLPPLPSPPLI